MTIEQWEVEDFRTALAEEIGTAATERFDELLRREREAMRSRCLEACAGWLDTSAGRAIDETIRGLQ